MKNLPSIIAAIVLVIVLTTYMCTYQVRSTEVAIVKTFGNANRTPVAVDENDRSFFAGLHLKWPWPIQSVDKYDKRLRLLEDRIEETPTKDSKQVIITTFTVWTISDPYLFHTSYETIKAGEEKLRARIRSHKKAIIGLHDFSDFVSTNPQDRKLQQIEEEMRDAVAAEASKEFGIDVKMFGIKQLSLPESVTKAVFDTMKSTQEVKAKRYRSEGKAEGNRIRAEAEESAGRIASVVQRKVKDIESQGEAEVGRIYSEFSAHEELRIFLDELRSLEEIMKTRTEIFLDTGDMPVNVFDEKKRIIDDDKAATAARDAARELTQEQGQ